MKYLQGKIESIYIKNPSRVYSYNSSNILTFESSKRVNLDQLIVYVSGFPVREPSLVLDFGEYIKIIEVKGKTQTILNIIGNIVCRGKTVAVVSSNNSATANVK